MVKVLVSHVSAKWLLVLSSGGKKVDGKTHKPVKAAPIKICAK